MLVPKDKSSVLNVKTALAARVSELAVELLASVQLKADTVKELLIAPEPLNAFAPVPVKEPVPVSVPELSVTWLAAATPLTFNVPDEFTDVLPVPNAEVLLTLSVPPLM